MYRDLEWMRMDALVAERLSASPRIYDVYGYCGLSLVSEFFQHGTIEDVLFTHRSEESDDETAGSGISSGGIDVGLGRKRGLSPRQKLNLAFNIAEAVSDLHGHTTGTIVHQDILPPQFMWNKDRTMVKLNDFNRAEIMLFNDHTGEYCSYGEPDIRYVRTEKSSGWCRVNDWVCSNIAFFVP